MLSDETNSGDGWYYYKNMSRTRFNSPNNVIKRFWIIRDSDVKPEEVKTRSKCV